VVVLMFKYKGHFRNLLVLRFDMKWWLFQDFRVGQEKVMYFLVKTNVEDINFRFISEQMFKKKSEKLEIARIRVQQVNYDKT
jgi:hypothetical protein